MWYFASIFVRFFVFFVWKDFETIFGDAALQCGVVSRTEWGPPACFFFHRGTRDFRVKHGQPRQPINIHQQQHHFGIFKDSKDKIILVIFCWHDSNFGQHGTRGCCVKKTNVVKEPHMEKASINFASCMGIPKTVFFTNSELMGLHSRNSSMCSRT